MQRVGLHIPHDAAGALLPVNDMESVVLYIGLASLSVLLGKASSQRLML